ncbi:MAG: hypothetical protein ACJ8OJ_16840 [Povalibacter sp.]
MHLMQRLGYDVHVFNVWRNRIKNSFVHAPGLRPTIHTAATSKQVLTRVARERFDLVIFNTLEGKSVLECAQQVLGSTPILGFIHNGSFIGSMPEYQPFVANPHCKLMVLAPYVANHFAHIARAGSMYPVFFFDREVPRMARTPGKRRFCVQGYFDPKRRHYELLLEAMKKLRAEGREDFEVYVMGRSLDKRFRDFARQIREAGLSDYVRYTWKGIGYGSYYRLLNSIDFVLPLISPESHPNYFKSKSTSSIAAAVGFNAVPVAHEKLAEYYSISDIAFTYTTDLLSAMRRALDISDAELAALRVRLQGTKDQYLRHSLDQLQQAITEVSARARVTVN